jgi:uncharacterized membrane protein YkvA (DUF1232 family)
MAQKKDLMVPPQGMFRNLLMRAKLVLRLMGDKRVNPWVKLIPIGALIYVVSPWDLIMVIPGVDALDDIAVASLGLYLFIELCPQDVVQEHMKKLTSNMDIIEGQNDVVDADSVEIKTDKK